MTQKYTVIISYQAEKELNEIVRYIQEELLEPNIAKNLFFKIKKLILELENFPDKFPIIKNEYMMRNDIRKCSIKNYVIIYRVNSLQKRVEISHIFYAKRNWMKIL